MKTYVYIDGFSLYYGALNGTQHKWLDLEKLCSLLLPNFQVSRIHYFSARIPRRLDDASRQTRQEHYWRALRTLPNVQMTLGKFVSYPAFMRLASPPPEGPQFARVLKNEEKGSDVNLATQLLVDSFLGRCEAAVVVTNDSDLTAPLQAARRELNLTVGLLNPERKRRRWSVQLVENVDFFKPIRAGVLAAAQFPPVLHDAQGTFHKPPAWE